LADFRRSKTAISTILEALNFDFKKNFTLENVKKVVGSLTNENFFDIKTAYLINGEDMFIEASDYLLKNMAQLEGTEVCKIFGETHVCLNKA